MDRNPILSELFRADIRNENQENAFTLIEITEHEKILMPYIDYICSVVELYALICLDNNIPKNTDALVKVGMSFQHWLAVLKNDKIHLKIRNSFSFLMRIIFYNSFSFKCTVYNYSKQDFGNVSDSKVEQMRKFIGTSCFNHQGFSDAKRFIHEKLPLINVKNTNTMISYINNIIEWSIKIIENGHSNSEFIDDCIKFAAFIFLTDYTDYANEIARQDTQLSRGIWIIKFLWKANSLRGCKHRIEALVTSTCNLLKVICKSRLNQQISVFMQLFRGYVDKNETPDVGSYIEAFSKDFEALFKIHNFTIHRPQISSEMRFKISSAKEKALKEQILKQDSDASEEEDEDEDEDEEEKKDEGPKRIEKAKIESEVVHDGNTDNVAYYKNVFVSQNIDNSVADFT